MNKLIQSFSIGVKTILLNLIFFTNFNLMGTNMNKLKERFIKLVTVFLFITLFLNNPVSAMEGQPSLQQQTLENDQPINLSPQQKQELQEIFQVLQTQLLLGYLLVSQVKFENVFEELDHNNEIYLVPKGKNERGYKMKGWKEKHEFYITFYLNWLELANYFDNLDQQNFTFNNMRNLTKIILNLNLMLSNVCGPSFFKPSYLDMQLAITRFERIKSKCRPLDIHMSRCINDAIESFKFILCCHGDAFPSGIISTIFYPPLFGERLSRKTFYLEKYIQTNKASLNGSFFTELKEKALPLLNYLRGVSKKT